MRLIDPRKKVLIGAKDVDEAAKIRLRAFKMAQNSDNFQKALDSLGRMNLEDKDEVRIKYRSRKNPGTVVLETL